MSSEPANSTTNDAAESGATPAPMTTSLMARLWIVPAIVVAVMIGVAMVVILFGASSVSKKASFKELLAQIESDSGARSLSGTVLSPRAKQTWQAAQELAVRIKKNDLTDEDRQAALAGLGKVVRGLKGAGSTAGGDPRAVEASMALRQFLVVALARLKVPEAIEPIAGLLDEDDADLRRIALQGLAEMHDVDGVQARLPAMYPLLEPGQPTEVRMVAALSVAAVAKRFDEVAIRQLSRMSADDVEVRLAKATALANLGSTSSKLTLLNMLDRQFWQGLNIDIGQSSGATRKLSEREIAQRICGIAPVAARLQHPDINEMLEDLAANDPSVQVREAVRQALDDAAAADEATVGHVG